MTRASVILDEARLQEVVSYFRTQPGFAFDIESQGEHRGVCHLNDVTWISLATRGSTVVVPFGHPIGSRIVGTHKEARLCTDGKTRNYTVQDYEDPPRQIPRDNVFEILRPLFFDRGITKNAHGAVFDIASTAKYWDEVMPGPYNDTIVQSWLLDENRRRHGLKYLVKDIYGYSYDDEEVGRCIEKHPFNKVAHYSFCDAVYCWLLAERFSPQIVEHRLGPVYELEMDILNVLVGMRLYGSHVDVKRLEELKLELADRRETVRASVFRVAGTEFNLNAPKQKQRILFESRNNGGQGLEPWKVTDGTRKKLRKGWVPANQTEWLSQWSTDDEVLESYPANPLCCTIRDYQEVHKLLSTYVLSYLGDPAADRPSQIYDDRIHADFVQYGTTTRRFSCREPNLQNIPRPDSELGKLIRGAWVAEAGRKLVVADYGQIELVMFAHYCGHGGLYDGFWAGLDPHQVTADKLEIERQMGKTINFSMAFGAGIKKIASMLGVDEQLARSILGDHRREFPEIYELKEEIVDLCRSRTPVPYVRTLLGGMRRLPDILHKCSVPRCGKGGCGQRYRAERQAVSSVIQGSAADLIKLAMVRTDSHPAIDDDLQLILTVHDEIVMDAPEDKADLAVSILEDAMLGPEIQSLIKVPLTADIKIVDRWSEAK